jgi:eukaryotic-like serine/threonine-protein kinase
VQGKKGNYEIRVAQQFGDKKSYLYEQSQFNMTYPVFSPDGNWISYLSKESEQRDEVYVQAFPLAPTSEKKQISYGGGLEPHWRKDGAELFYLTADGKLKAVQIRKSATTFEVVTEEELFQIQGKVSNNNRFYAPIG